MMKPYNCHTRINFIDIISLSKILFVYFTFNSISLTRVDPTPNRKKQIANIKKPKICVTKLMHQLNTHINALVNIFEFIAGCGPSEIRVNGAEKECREIYDSCADAERCVL